MQDETSHSGLTRRGFLSLTSAGLVMPMAFALTSRAAAAAGQDPVMIGAFIRLAADNTVTVVIGSTEMGQGIMTGLAQLVAAELRLDWSQVRAEHAPASTLWPNPYGNPIFGAQLTGGSTAMMGWYTPMRQAAAIVRDTLILAANTAHGGSWTLGDGGRLTNGGQTLSFADLMADAAQVQPPQTAQLLGKGALTGVTMPRLDIPAKVDGSAQFGLDVRRPGMVFATVVHPSVLGSTVKTMPGPVSNATLVNLGNAVGVVSTDTWTAMKAAKSIASKIKWTAPVSTAGLDSPTLAKTAATLLTSTTVTPQVGEQKGTPDPASGTYKLDATYTLPFLIHAPMEVLNCTAQVTAQACEIWVPTQGQQFIIPAVAAATGLAPSAITVHTTFVGGGFGRKIETDYVLHAVKLSKAVNKPVKVTWTRESDFSADMYRPMAALRVRASVEPNGTIGQWVYRNVSASINLQRGYTNSQNPEDTGALAGAMGLPYKIANKRIEFVALQPCDIPLGYWRSVGEGYNTFAVESAMDELALAAGKDPIAFRKAALTGEGGDPRALGVLTAVETLSNWGTAPAAGRARGVAMMKGFGSYIAVVMEVSRTTLSSRYPAEMKVERVYAALDCGIAVNPGQVEYQIQGGLLHGLSAALWHGQTFAKGKPAITNFNRYPVLKLAAAPQIDVQILPSDAAPGGVGETGVPCAAPALANAWAKLTGKRLRSLPFYPGKSMSDD